MGLSHRPICGRPASGRRWGVLCQTGLVLVTSAAVAHAEPEERVTWDAPAECPSRDHVVVKLEHILGRRLEELARSPRASARVERSADGFTLLLTLDGSDAMEIRKVSAERCEELADAAAVQIAIAIDASVAEPTPEPEAPVETEEPAGLPLQGVAPAVAVPRDQASTEGTRKNDTGVEVAPSLGVFGSVDAFALGGLAPGVGGRFAVALGPHFRAEALGAYFFEQRVRDEQGLTAVDLSLWFFGGRACFITEGAFRGLFCGGGEGGRMTASGAEISQPRTDAGRWLAPVVGVGLMRPLGQAALTGSIEAVFPLWAERFAVDQGGRSRTLHELGHFDVRVLLGAELGL